MEWLQVADFSIVSSPRINLIVKIIVLKNIKFIRRFNNLKIKRQIKLLIIIFVSFVNNRTIDTSGNLALLFSFFLFGVERKE